MQLTHGDRHRASDHLRVEIRIGEVRVDEPVSLLQQPLLADRGLPLTERVERHRHQLADLIGHRHRRRTRRHRRLLGQQSGQQRAHDVRHPLVGTEGLSRELTAPCLTEAEPGPGPGEDTQLPCPP
ncbi:hypothetical protein M8330_20875 [Nocardioides sp. BSK12Z-4]|uniref:Uncharacterized protein n=1 Tax=Nocardioides bruguierae TaxID=2945102 RepID=A0A9X2IHM1_9ACTN|nr:hypothetical protein [Nocardioides bruguierae]MCM0622749.1 hypothetical protein [Nocardioides bruguierae]